MRKTIQSGLLAAALALPATQAGATAWDVSQNAGDCSGNIGSGAYACSSSGTENVGTGVWQPFLRSSTNDATYGMYSSSLDKDAGNPVSDPWTYSPTLGMLGTVNINNVNYFSFALDIDQQGNVPGSFLTVTDLKIYVNSAGNLSAATLASLSPLWAMTAADSLLTDYRFNSGSGLGVDMFLYVPTSLFTGLASTQHLYLYNENSGNNDGPEEWQAMLCRAGENCTPPPPPPPPDVLPEPGTLGLLGLGLIGVGFVRRRRAI